MTRLSTQLACKCYSSPYSRGSGRSREGRSSTIATPRFSTNEQFSRALFAFSELAQDREQIARFGEGLKPMLAIARQLT